MTLQVDMHLLYKDKPTYHEPYNGQGYVDSWTYTEPKLLQKCHFVQFTAVSGTSQGRGNTNGLIQECHLTAAVSQRAAVRLVQCELPC